MSKTKLITLNSKIPKFYEFRVFSTSATFNPLDLIKAVGGYTIKAIADPRLLAIAYEKIKKKHLYVDHINLEQISQKLLTGEYKFGRVKESLNFRDDLVQTAMLIVLELTYETRLGSSSQFIPGKGSHKALKEVLYCFKSADWIIKCDILNCYDSIDIERLLEQLQEEARPALRCHVTRRLIADFLRFPFFDSGDENNLYFFFCNFHLSGIDSIKKLGVRNGPVYRSTQAKIARTEIPEEKKELRKKLRAISRKKAKEDHYFRRVIYVRHGNTMLLGVLGQSSCDEVLKNFEESIKPWGLLLRSKFFDFNKESFSFLDTQVKKGETGLKIHFEVPVISLQEEARAAGFLKEIDGKWEGVANEKLATRSHPEILRVCNEITRGIINYYSFAVNKIDLLDFLDELRNSCALTLGSKSGLSSTVLVFQKFGESLKCKSTKIVFHINKTFTKKKPFFRVKDDLPSPTEIFNKKELLDNY